MPVASSTEWSDGVVEAWSCVGYCTSWLSHPSLEFRQDHLAAHNRLYQPIVVIFSGFCAATDALYPYFRKGVISNRRSSNSNLIASPGLLCFLILPREVAVYTTKGNEGFSRRLPKSYSS
jgi:hypothetical protein